MYIYDFFNLPDDCEFYNIDLDSDTLAFLDPFLIRTVPTSWNYRFKSKINDFMKTLICELKNNNVGNARILCNFLSECNYVHLGYSISIPKGNGLGKRTGEELCNAIIQSQAFEEGDITYLEDLPIFIPSVGSDRISDICAKIILFDLVDFTNEMILKYSDEFKCKFQSKKLWSWNSEHHKFEQKECQIPIYKNIPFLLVPKTSVSQDHVILKGFSDFIQIGILSYYQDQANKFPEIADLITKNAKGEIIVPTKKDIRSKLGNESEIYARYMALAAADRKAIIDLYKRKKYPNK